VVQYEVIVRGTGDGGVRCGHGSCQIESHSKIRYSMAPCELGHKRGRCEYCQGCKACPAPNSAVGNLPLAECAASHRVLSDSKGGRRVGSRNHSVLVEARPSKRRSVGRPESYKELDIESPKTSSGAVSVPLVKKVCERIYSVLTDTSKPSFPAHARARVKPLTARQLADTRIAAEATAYMHVLTDSAIDVLADGDPESVGRLQQLRQEAFTPDTSSFIGSALDVLVRTPEAQIRRQLLALSCSSLPPRNINELIIAAEQRARTDISFMKMLQYQYPNRQHNTDPVPPSWYNRLWQDYPLRNPVGRNLYQRLRKENDYFMATGKYLNGYVYKSRVTPDQIMTAFKVIEELCAEGWSYQMKLNQVAGRHTTFLKRNMTKERMFKAYQAMAQPTPGVEGQPSILRINGVRLVGKHTFSSMVDAATKANEHQAGISYYLDNVLETLRQTEEILDRLAVIRHELVSVGVVGADVAGDNTFNDLKTDCERMRLGVRDGFYKHCRLPSMECDGDAAHCTKHALGACENESPRVHTLSCKVCAPAFYVPIKIKRVVEEVFRSMCQHCPTMRLARVDEPATAYDELSSMMAACSLLCEEIKGYHSHILRGHWQKAYLTQRVERLPCRSMEMQFDYMMKVGDIQLLHLVKLY